MELQFSNLSLSLTKSLTKKEKKENGIFFTPSNIIKKSYTLINNHINIKNINNILEPSCGSCEIINYLDKKIKSNIDAIEINNNIYNNIKKLNFNNKVNIMNNDFLLFHTIKKYNLIIGNPPYFVMKKKDINKKYYEYFSGRPNIFILFIIKSLELLEINGIMCFILPKSFLNCLYYNKLRNHIHNNYSILDIVSCYNDTFIETKQDTIILLIQNNKTKQYNNDFNIMINNNILFNTKDNIININNLYKNTTTLHQLNFSVKVGNISWEKNKHLLSDNNNHTRLIYSNDIINNKLSITTFKNKEKKNYINKKGKNDLILIINRGYGIGKYNFKYCLIDELNYLLENHIIYIEYNDIIEKNELRNLYNKIINSFNNKNTIKFIHMYFNNNAINTEELQYILPIYI